MPFWFLRNVVEMGYDAGLYRNKAAVQRQTGRGGDGADNSSDSLATKLGTGHIFNVQSCPHSELNRCIKTPRKPPADWDSAHYLETQDPTLRTGRRR